MRANVTGSLVTVLVSAALLAGGCAGQKRTALWNGKDFSGWKLFIPDEKVNVNDVWSVKDGVIHCTGKPNGYMRTEDDYSDYKLHLEWRWGEGQYERRNSGVLLHMSGADRVWPKCIEAQLMSENAGDFWLIGGTAITVDGRRTESAGGPTRVVKKSQHSEQPIGRWNSYDIFCKGDTIRCLVNGVLQNHGTSASERSGKICLQSEGAPIEFRNIYIENLD